LKIISISALPLWVMGEKKGLPSIYYGAKSLVDAGHEVHFITPFRHLWRKDLDGQSTKKKIKDELYDGIHVHRFVIPLLPFLRSVCRIPQPSRKVLRYAKQLAGFLSLGVIWVLFTTSALMRARGIARERKPDVVYAHNGIAAAAAYLLARMYKVPNITKIYGTFLSQVPQHTVHALLYFPETLGFKIPSNYLIVDNDGTQGDKVAARLGIPPARLKFWMNGVDKDMYDPNLTVPEAKRHLGISPDTKVILTLGRLDGWKGVDKLIRAAPDIIARYPNVLMLIVGDGNEKKNLERLAGALELENRVRFEGAVPHANVKDYLHAADVFVSTQDVTNFGIHIMEAMVCGRCVVTLNNGDTGNFIKNNDTGILLEPDRLELLPSAIVTLLHDDALRNRLAENALRFAHQNFQTWEERMSAEVRLVEQLGDLAMQ